MAKPLPRAWANVEEIEELAVPRLPAAIAGYYTGYSGSGVTIKDTRDSFARWRLLPRCLRDVSRVDTSCSLLGRKLEMPILVAPMAMQCMADPVGESGVARATKELGGGMILSTMSTISLEEVAQAAGPDGFLMFQLYVLSKREVTEAMVRRAERAGYKAIVVTVDAPRLGKRDEDERLQFRCPPHLRLANLAELQKDSAAARAGQESSGSGFAAFFTALIDPSLTWECITWLRGITSLPIFVKGILSPDDARQAVKAGVAGIVVSTHGGRQLDGTPAPLDVLPFIARAVAGAVPILIDGGIRRGSDVLKCLALGATAVLVGRPILWGLTLGGEEGAKAVLSTLRTELEHDMALLGVPSLAQLNEDYIIPPSGGVLALPAARL